MSHSTITEDTTPDIADVGRMIDGVSSEIDSRLSQQGIAVPVTGPLWFMDMLRSIAADGATALALRSMYPDTRGPGETPAFAYFEKRYQDALKGFADGSTIPPGLATGGANILSSNYFTRNPDEEEELGDLEGDSFFTVEQRF